MLPNGPQMTQMAQMVCWIVVNVNPHLAARGESECFVEIQGAVFDA
jgi:hypothetical protein